jgi:hypothetical protein
MIAVLVVEVVVLVIKTFVFGVVYFFYLTQQPPVGQGLLIHEVSRSHSMTHHSRQDSSGRVISSSQDFLLTTHIIHDRQTSMPTVAFNPTISAAERQQGPA